MKVLIYGKTGYEKVKRKAEELGFNLVSSKPELVIVVGGDGHFLNAARKYPDSILFGLRKESKGRLIDHDFENFQHVLERIQKKKYKIEYWPRVELIYRDVKVWGLNEVYFFRKHLGATRFRVYIGGKDVYKDELYGDGCLAATSQGSTAYNFSLRGKILPQGSKHFQLTPIAASHMNKALRAESVTIPEGKVVVVRITRDSPNQIVADNAVSINKGFKAGDEIIFRKSKSKTKILKLLWHDNESFEKKLEKNKRARELYYLKKIRGK